jgi:hypothetical protein
MKITHPVRVSHAYTQHLEAPAEKVFPLLCPVREAEWIDGWDPSVVYTSSGVAEEDCVFITGSGAEEAIWTVIAYAPAQGHIEFIKTMPGHTIARVRIHVLPVDARSCTALVEYQYTSLGPAGEQFVSSFKPDHYLDFMRAWEDRLNHYLMTGVMLQR